MQLLRPHQRARTRPQRGAEPEKREPVEAEPNKPAPPRKRAGEPTKHAGQVAVFISKREKKIFVRQGFVPVFDMPIEIADPDQPLGTHVFTAMGFTDDGAHDALERDHDARPTGLARVDRAR